MICSMTGYGKEEINLDKVNINIEIKSLNSKYIDVNIKMPSQYRSREMDLRKYISDKLKRGKVEISIWLDNTGIENKFMINKKAIKNYHKQIEDLSIELGLSKNNLVKNQDIYTQVMQTIVHMPDVFLREENKNSHDKKEWDIVYTGIKKAINGLIQYREEEGAKLKEDFLIRLKNIFQLLEKIEPLSLNRINKIRKNISEKLIDLELNHIDESRFEQEIIYYLEKQDITEEQVRLKSHLSYFEKSMQSPPPNGKKLVFISQEIGREINTIGSKSSDLEIQKIVVKMKDELEKIKEQLLNIL